MGITRQTLELLYPYLLPGRTVLALGWPDMVIPPSEFGAMFPELGASGKLVADFEAMKWHGLSYLPATFHSFAEALRLGRVDVLDYHQWRGSEILADLNMPIGFSCGWGDGPLHYDIVLDHGTIEHCMNVGQALVNCANLTKPGGLVFHGSPVTMVNHGFYNISPTLFQDFYRGNGWEILQHAYSVDGQAVTILDPFSRDRLQAEVSQLFLARKGPSAVASPSWHMQTKYRRMMERGNV